MRSSTFFAFLTAALFAASGVLAFDDDGYSGALTARDVFEDDLVQERYFDDIEEYDARDYLDDDYEVRDLFDDDLLEERAGRGRRGGKTRFGRVLGKIGTHAVLPALANGAQIAATNIAQRIGAPNPQAMPAQYRRGYYDDEEELMARAIPGAKKVRIRRPATGRVPSRIPGAIPRNRADGLPKPIGSRIPHLVPGGERPSTRPTGIRGSRGKGLSRSPAASDSVSGREFLEEILDERSQQSKAARRRRQRQRRRKGGKKGGRKGGRKGKKPQAAPATADAAGSLVPAPDSPPADAAAPVQQRGLDIDDLE